MWSSQSSCSEPNVPYVPSRKYTLFQLGTGLKKICLKEQQNCGSIFLTHFLPPSSPCPPSPSRGVTVHMVLQHCWSPVATLPTMHLWGWDFERADRLIGPRYRRVFRLVRDGPGAAADSVPTEHTLTQCLQSIPSTFYLLYSPTESEVRRVCVCVMEDILIFPQLYADDVRLFFWWFRGVC